MFALFITVGAVVALGLRSRAAVEAPSPMKGSSMAAAAASDSHSTAGHPGHAHAGEDAVGTQQPAPPAGSDPVKAKPTTQEPTTKKVVADEGTEAKGVLLELGNALCPVMGGEADGTTFTEWNGLRVEHCCAGCSKRFLKNPESLLDEVSPKWRDAAKAAKEIDLARGDERAKLLAAAGKRWKVLRKPTSAPVAAVPAASRLLVDLGNTECPVMGGGVDGSTFTEWNGMRINHCCPGCSKRFLKDPESLLDEVSKNWRSLRDALKKYESAEGEDRSAALSAIRAKWTVVREPESDEG